MNKEYVCKCGAIYTTNGNHIFKCNCGEEIIIK